jgi:PPK2 family polyphosphate:nucleotide phosphotransferase
MNFRKSFIVKPGQKVRLSRFDPADTNGFDDKAAAAGLLQRNIERLAKLQDRLYAEHRHALLIVLQAMDAGGKDGTVRHVMSGVNPQGCRVTSFKAPTAEELAHDFLWRIHQAVPDKGEIGIFNRSHYEDVLIVRVHDLVPKSVWSARYAQINHFEQTLAASGVTILKFFLHISRAEQRDRLEARLHDPDKNWKMNPADLVERKRWDDYTIAYEDALSRCSTDWAPWFIIPANKKWFRNVAVSGIIVAALERLDPQYPKPAPGLAKLKVV